MTHMKPNPTAGNGRQQRMGFMGNRSQRLVTDRLAARARVLADEAEQYARQVPERLSQPVRSRPMTAVGAGFGLGVGLGLTLVTLWPAFNQQTLAERRDQARRLAESARRWGRQIGSAGESATRRAAKSAKELGQSAARQSAELAESLRS